MNSVVNLKDGFITFNSNIDHSLSFSKCAIGYSNYNINSHERGSLVFLTNNNANDTNISMNDIRMCIASDGNVGIGTNNPLSSLHLHKTATIQDVRIILTDGTTTSSSRGLHLIKEGDGTSSLFNYEDAPLLLGTNGTTKMYIESYGNVGIGTNDPSSKLHLHRENTTTPQSVYLLFTDTLTGTNASDGFMIGKSSDNSANLYNNEDTHMAFATNGGERMRITNSGNVGIGTNADIQSILTINGINTGLANNINHSEAPLTITNPTATSTSVLNDPKAVLNLCRTGTSGQAYSARACFKLCRYENSIPNSRTRLDITLAHNAYDDLNIMSLQSGGNVGIGITNPEHKLDINGGINCTTDIRVGGDWYWKATKNMYLQTSANNLEWSMDMQNQNTYTGCYWQVWSDKTGLGSILACRGDTGNVGIRNTAPGYALDVTGDINITGSFRVNGTAFTSSSSQWTTNGTNIYYNSGNVGIGISPNYKLDVNGDVYVGNNSYYLSDHTGTASSQFFGKKYTTTILGGMEIENTTLGGNYSQKLHFHTHRYGGLYGRRMTINEDGNVGIGTTNPQRPLHVQTAMRIGGSGACIDFGDDMKNQIYRTTTLNELVFTTNAIDRLIIDGGGTVKTSGGLTVGSDLFIESSRLVIRGASPTIYLKDTNERSGMIHMNANVMYFLNASGADSETWLQQNGQDWCLQLNMNTNLATFGGILQVNGDIRSNGNITAYYSDERLKTITEYVSDVLPTLSKIRVFRYNCNDLAASYGYDKNKKEIGLSAQEIQKYYPEVVSIAPFDAKYDEETKELISKSGEKYLTLDYERLVPILLQGIKDLNNIVEKMQENEKNMKNEINNIKLILEKLEV